MPDPKKQDPDVQPEHAPSHPYRKPSTKPVGRDSDATPGKDDEPARTPNRVNPHDVDNQPRSGQAPGKPDSTEA